MQKDSPTLITRFSRKIGFAKSKNQIIKKSVDFGWSGAVLHPQIIPEDGIKNFMEKIHVIIFKQTKRFRIDWEGNGFEVSLRIKHKVK